jgi:hypothetical protein
MLSFGGDLGVFVYERRLDEELVGISATAFSTLRSL